MLIFSSVSHSDDSLMVDVLAAPCSCMGAITLLQVAADMLLQSMLSVKFSTGSEFTCTE